METTILGLYICIETYIYRRILEKKTITMMGFFRGYTEDDAEVNCMPLYAD